MWQDRCFRTLLLSLLLLIGAGIWKPQSVNPIEQVETAWDRFWVIKTHSRPAFDMILLGDSRVYRGLSPEVMQNRLPDYRILNFGYSSGGLNPMMYRAAESKFDPSSTRKVIVLGVTPHSLTPETAANEHFLQEKTRSLDYRLELRYGAPVVQFFKPTTIEVVYKQAIGREPVVPRILYYQEFHDSGWVASWTVPESQTRALTPYRDIFTENRVSPELVQQLMQHTEEWVQRDIAVFAFRFPATAEMIALENEKSGFDQHAFVQQFEAAGGTWLSLPTTTYHSYDGNHLVKESAVQLSHDIAMCIEQQLTSAARVQSEESLSRPVSAHTR